MDNFTPISSSIGGLLIGLAAAVLWLANGRIAGISGIFGNLLPPGRVVSWRLGFLIAMIVGCGAASWLIPGLGIGGPGGYPPELASAPQGVGMPTEVWIGIAGLLTGLGTTIGNGCTSGHGVCGIARLSRRSFVAVGIFFVTAIVTATLTGVV